MTSSYALTIELPQPLAAVIDTLRAALAAEQMGVTRIALRAPVASAT